jgi:hypothetical protein
VAGVALVVLMFALAVLVATAQHGAVEAVQAGAPAVKQWGGRILLVVGAWLIALAVFAGFFARVFPV